MHEHMLLNLFIPQCCIFLSFSFSTLFHSVDHNEYEQFAAIYTLFYFHFRVKVFKSHIFQEIQQNCAEMH